MPKDREPTHEFSAFPLVAIVSAIGCAIFAGIWLGFWAAVIVTAGFALGAIGGLIWWATRRGRLGEAPQVTPIADGRYRILVVADERCAAPSITVADTTGAAPTLRLDASRGSHGRAGVRGRLRGR